MYSDIPLVRHLNHVNGKPCSNGDGHTGGDGASFLVPYTQESSEESDQENGGTQDTDFDKCHLNGNNKIEEVQEKSPPVTNGESGGLHNGHRINGSANGAVKSNQDEHHKVNGHDTTNEVIHKLCVLFSSNLQMTKQQLYVNMSNHLSFFPSQKSDSYNGSLSSLPTVAANGLDNDHIHTK